MVLIVTKVSSEPTVDISVIEAPNEKESWSVLAKRSLIQYKCGKTICSSSKSTAFSTGTWHPLQSVLAHTD
jgi:hypothetical protein